MNSESNAPVQPEPQAGHGVLDSRQAAGLTPAALPSARREASSRQAAGLTPAALPSARREASSRQTTCCVAGGGPAGVVLSCMLARKGINYAIHERVAAANLLSEPLKAGRVTDSDPAHVQRRRERPTLIIQGIANVILGQFIRNALDPSKPIVAGKLAGIVAWPGVSDIIALVFAYGISPEHVKE